MVVGRRAEHEAGHIDARVTSFELVGKQLETHELVDRLGDQMSVVDVVTDPNALSLPPQITVKQIRGFATAVGKTVLAGGVGKMLDLARANLRNVRAI